MVMKIFVQPLTGDQIELYVSPSDTIDEIKARVKDAIGMEPDDQHLAHVADLLDDGTKTLSEYGIENGDVLFMGMEIFVVTPTGEKFSVYVHPSDTIEEIQHKIEEKTGIEPHHQHIMFNGELLDDPTKTLSEYGVEEGSTLNMMMEIFVVPLKGETIALYVSPADTINDVKDKVKEATGIAPDDQHLTFNGEGLDDGTKTLSECGIEDESILRMTMLIHVVTLTGETITVRVSPVDTIDQIKAKVRDETGMEPDDQHLLFNGAELEDGSKSLSEYGIEDGSTLHMGMVIYVETLTGEEVTLAVLPTDTISEIKDRIKDATGIEPTDQHLTFNGELLDDGTKTLAECNIVDGSILKINETPPEDSCTIYGDPHIVGFGKVPHHLSFVEASGSPKTGDTWLVKTALVHIQGRFNADVKGRSFLKALAVGGPFLQNNTFFIGTKLGQVFWNQEEILTSLPSSYQNGIISAKYHSNSVLVQDPTQKAKATGLDVDLPLGVKLLVNQGKNGLAIKISMPKIEDGQEGECGNRSPELTSKQATNTILPGDLLFRHVFVN
jgi:uncharacterized ubiquitin-like protein YukD